MRTPILTTLIMLPLLSTPAYPEIISSEPSNCEKGFCTQIPCENGYCEGWEGSYEILAGNSVQGGSLGGFFFKNKSGKVAFDIRIMVNFFDYFGGYIGRIELNENGPIYSHLSTKGIIPKETGKISFNIYWSDEYLPARQTKKPVE
jgi:hypothetical protein